MAKRWLAGLIGLVFVTSASAQTDKRPLNQEPPVWRQLERFSNDAEFLRYVRDVQRLRPRERYYGGAADEAIGIPPPPPPPPPAPPPPPGAAPAPMVSGNLSDVVVTAQASNNASAEPSSITNVQTQGVDEGGIVKQIGRFLVVLQDGRIFVADTRPNGQPGMALVGRTNVYRDARFNTWYDEMLVSGNRILVTGYSYRDRASEVNVFTIDDNGHVARETTYYISSNDYYDVENYATRLVNGNLVIYTPLDLTNINVNAPIRWPLIRRWVRDGERQAVTTRGRPLFDAHDIYKPVQRTMSPMVHSVSVCPLGGPGSGDELECRTTAFVGQTQREFFVSTQDIYLWVTPGYGDGVGAGSCDPEGSPAPATIFQVPLDGRTPRALHARGVPSSQLALDASPDEFRALVSWSSLQCPPRGNHPEVRYFRAPLASFSSTPVAAPARAFVEEPSPRAAQYEVRFTSTHVVYGAREGYSSYPPEEGAAPLSARLVAVPVARPNSPTVIEAPHNILRVERAGADIVTTGYRTDAGLSVSLIDLSGRPRIADTRVLEGRYESENRSHAFNSLVGPEGDGLMGLPTVTRTKEGGRWWFRSQASDVSFIGVNRANRLAPAGELLATQNAQDPSYSCEVSCVDWYGNSRALFIGNRVFALSATELIEGALQNGRIADRGRLNLSAPVR